MRSDGTTHDERMFDVVADAIRVAIAHEMIVSKVSGQHHQRHLSRPSSFTMRFQTGTNENISLTKTHRSTPKNVPKVSLRTRILLFELEDGAFEWKLGMIYRAGRVEQLQRQAREEAFRVKVKRRSRKRRS